MPDTGVPESHVLPAVTNSHTATEQWQSFEMRMRHRRAERCRLRAEAAIDAGALEEADEALQEARHLAPHLQELSAATKRLAEERERRAAATIARPRRITARKLAAAAALAFGVGFWGWLMAGDSAAPATPVTAGLSTAAAEPAREQPAPAPSDLAAPSVPAPAATTGQEAPATTAMKEETAARESAATEVSNEPPVTRDSPVAGAARSEVAQTQPLRQEPERSIEPMRTIPTPMAPPTTPPPQLTRTPAVADAPLPAPPSAENLVTVPAPSSALPPATPPSAPAPPASSSPSRAAPPEPAPEVAVRSTLSRYEAAYSALDANAARVVWPTVNAGALGRAFESLQSQKVSLGACAVTVAPGGDTASAQCNGTATWTPKVGGGRRTESRRWTFDLERAGEQWQIVRALTR